MPLFEVHFLKLEAVSYRVQAPDEATARERWISDGQLWDADIIAMKVVEVEVVEQQRPPA